MEAEFLKKIVKEAENISRKNFEVHQKGDEGDLVTNLDLEIEKYLIGQIQQNYPDYTIVSEEFNSGNTADGNCFTIDPIDGTVNFANGLPLWGIQVACKKNGETVASVIDLPELGEFYFADETGAYLNDQKISIKEVPIKNAVYFAISRDTMHDVSAIQAYSRNYRDFGSACVAMAFLASGRIHGVNIGLEQPWDYEPGLFLCKMAGAKTKGIKDFHAAAMNQEFLDILGRLY